MKITLNYSKRKNGQDQSDTNNITIYKDGKALEECGYYYIDRAEYYCDDFGIEVADSEADFIKMIEEYFSNK